MRFEWDAKRVRLNRSTHGVTFEDAGKVFDDPLQLSVVDRRFGYFEELRVTIGATTSKKSTTIGLDNDLILYAALREYVNHHATRDKPPRQPATKN